MSDQILYMLNTFVCSRFLFLSFAQFSIFRRFDAADIFECVSFWLSFNITGGLFGRLDNAFFN